MHAHDNLRQYSRDEIQTIHPRLVIWLEERFSGFEPASLMAHVSSCEDGNCPVTVTILKFRVRGRDLELKVGRILHQISRLDFSLAAEKQFPYQ